MEYKTFLSLPAADKKQVRSKIAEQILARSEFKDFLSIPNARIYVEDGFGAFMGRMRVTFVSDDNFGSFDAALTLGSVLEIQGIYYTQVSRSIVLRFRDLYDLFMVVSVEMPVLCMDTPAPTYRSV